MAGFSKILNNISSALSNSSTSEGHSPKSNNGTGSSLTKGVSFGSSNRSIDKYHTDKLNKTTPPECPIRLSIKIESPPLVLFGSAEECSGAIFSGLIYLEIFGKPTNELSTYMSNDNLPNIQSVNDSLSPSLTPMKSVTNLSKAQLATDYVELKSVNLCLIQVIKYGKPFVPASSAIQNCSDCAVKTTELASWDVLNKATAFAKGSAHGYPFSYLVPGSLPPTTNLSNFHTSVRYELILKAEYINQKGRIDYINMSLPVIIRRSILRGQDRNSIRAFPPTDVTASAVIPNVAYPKSVLPVEIRINNVSKPERRWRMRKLTWRVEESTRVRTQACSKHLEKFSSTVEASKKANKGKKLHKNSGGPGAPVINFFYEPPARRVRAVPEEGGGEGNNNGNTDGTPNSPNNNNSSDRFLQDSDRALVDGESSPPALYPFASNWSNNGLQPEGSHNFIDDHMNYNDSGNGNELSGILSNEANIAPQPSVAESVVSIANSLDVAPLPSNSELYVEELKTISNGELKSGWKSDFSNTGRIEIVAEISTMNLQTCGLNTTLNNLSLINSKNCNQQIFNDQVFEEANVSCDIEDHESGIFVSHNLVIEVVVAEELMKPTYMASVRQTSNNASAVHNHLHNTPINSNNTHNNNSNNNSNANGNTSSASLSNSNQNEGSSSSQQQQPGFDEGKGTGPDYITGNNSDPVNQLTGVPTGVARVLRMQFKLIMTERSGLGVAWDDEVPPIYPAISALSPPTYDQATSGTNTPVITPSLSAIQLNELDNVLGEVPLPSPTPLPQAHVSSSTIHQQRGMSSPQMSSRLANANNVIRGIDELNL